MNFPKKGVGMNAEQEKPAGDRAVDLQDDEAIDKAFIQMEVIYKSRCVQAPHGNNVTIREIKKQE